jgi:hypothetical protein
MTHSNARSIEYRATYFYEVRSLHENYNEAWYEYQCFLRFRETGRLLSLPENLLDGVRSEIAARDESFFDLSMEAMAERLGRIEATSEEIMQTGTIRVYLNMIEDDPPRNIPMEEVMRRDIVGSDEHDARIVARMVYANNHHWNVVSCERFSSIGEDENEDYFLARADFDL